MKKIFIPLILFSILSCNSNLETNKMNDNIQISSNENRGTAIGDIRYHTIKTNYLKSKNRNIVIYLPPSYKTDNNKKYPVIYMNDGQNIFDKSTGAFGKEWYVDEKIEYLIKKNVIDEIIIVGVYNGLAERMNEYTWTKDSEYGGGEGKNYADFLIKDLKPFIDKNYRTKKDKNNTAILGSSLGGLISFYMINNYSNYFGKAGFMSPSFWWNNGEPLKEKINFTNSTIWIDGGTKEGSNPENMIKNINTIYSNIITKNPNTLKYVDENSEHNEEAWAKRIHAPLIQFFGKQKSKEEKFNLIKRLMILEEWNNL